MNATEYITLAAYALILVVSGVMKNREVLDEKSYLLAGRRTGLFALTATLVMTEFNTSTLIAFSSVGYFAGFWGIALPSVFFFGLGFYTIAVAAKWKTLNALSVAELFSLRYGADLGKLASIFLLTAMIGFSATYVKSMTLIFSPFFPGLNDWTLSAILVGIILLMTLRGGLASVISTDVISFIATLVLIPAIFIFTLINSENLSGSVFGDIQEKIPMDLALHALPPEFVLSLIILTMFTYISAPWYGQKIFSAISVSTAVIAVGISAFLIFFLYSLPVLAVAILKTGTVQLDTPDKALPYIISTKLEFGFKGLAYGVLFSAAATTLSGVWSAMTTMVIGDFAGQKNGSVSRSIAITLSFAIASYALGNTLIDKVLNKLILANIPVAALSFALLAGFYWKKASRTGAYVSIVTGLSCGIGSYLYFGDAGGYTWYWAIYGIPLTFISGILFSLLFPSGKEENEIKSKFFERMGQI